MSCEPLVVVRPFPLTDSTLTYSNVPEDDAPAWNAGTTYAADAPVIFEHNVYHSAQASNVGHRPDISPTYWTLMGATNRWSPFDRSYDSQVKQADSIIYEVTPDQVATAFAALNVSNATAMRITMTHPDYPDPVYEREFDMIPVPLEPLWWGWWFSERTAPSQSLATDLPSFPGATIRIEIEGGPDLGVGVLLIGSSNSFGVGVRYGARVGFDDYSLKERDGFGNLRFVERAWNKRANLPLTLEWQDVDRFNSFCAEIRALPCLWIGSSVYESTTIYGIFGTLDILISHPNHATCEIDLRGLT